MTDNTEPTIDELVEMCFDDLCINNTGNYIRITFGDKSMNVDYEHFLAFRKRIEALISDQVAKAKYDIAEEMGKMMEIQGVNGTWNYDPYMHGMYNGMEFCHALVKGVEPKYRKAPKQWLADIPMPKNAKPTQTYPKRSKQ